MRWKSLHFGMQGKAKRLIGLVAHSCTEDSPAPRIHWPIASHIPVGPNFPLFFVLKS